MRAERGAASVDGQDSPEPSGGNVSAETSPLAEGDDAGPSTSKGQGRPTGQDAREKARANHPELAARYERYQAELALSEEDADILTGSTELSDFFEAAHGAGGGDAALATPLANWVVNDLLRELKGRSLDQVSLTPEHLAALVEMVESDVISHSVARDVFQDMVEEGVDPRVRVKEEGLEKVTDRGALRPLVDQVLAGHPDKVQAYRDGKTGLLGFFMGQVMRQTQGKADPELVKELLAGGLDG